MVALNIRKQIRTALLMEKGDLVGDLAFRAPWVSFPRPTIHCLMQAFNARFMSTLSIFSWISWKKFMNFYHPKGCYLVWHNILGHLCPNVFMIFSQAAWKSVSTYSRQVGLYSIGVVLTETSWAALEGLDWGRCAHSIADSIYVLLFVWAEASIFNFKPFEINCSLNLKAISGSLVRSTDPIFDIERAWDLSSLRSLSANWDGCVYYLFSCIPQKWLNYRYFTCVLWYKTGTVRKYNLSWKHLVLQNYRKAQQIAYF